MNSSDKIHKHNDLYRQFLDSCEEMYPEIPRDKFNEAFHDVILNLTTFGPDGLIINHKKWIERKDVVLKPIPESKINIIKKHLKGAMDDS